MSTTSNQNGPKNGTLTAECLFADRLRDACLETPLRDDGLATTLGGVTSGRLLGARYCDPCDASTLDVGPYGRIYAVEDGRIVEAGTGEKLINR